MKDGEKKNGKENRMKKNEIKKESVRERDYIRKWQTISKCIESVWNFNIEEKWKISENVK